MQYLGRIFPHSFTRCMLHIERGKGGGREEELKSEEVTRGRADHKNSSESLKLGKSYQDAFKPFKKDLSCFLSERQATWVNEVQCTY